MIQSELHSASGEIGKRVFGAENQHLPRGPVHDGTVRNRRLVRLR